MTPRLKSLELHGYKTFANRTAFEFPGPVTAIVGPNGSGKSNIADALRWVLGEQSYSLLRGKKTEDMIFAGSEQRARAGMASATVIFDNSDDWLPIDFTEVAIARRAYRDGENEYLLNGQRVRLRDVSELLAQSGLAERTYTIIGQGLVDAALALKAEERRRLFEEAAGIGLHRSRREEALRRLETTQRNLQRVEDILAELQPRLRSLERQARRAQEYEQVKADLHLLLREWYGYHWHHAQSELAQAREAARSREKALDAARQAQASLDQQLQVLRERIQDLRAQLNDLHRQSAKLHGEREGTSRQLAVSDERMHFLEGQEQETLRAVSRATEETSLIEDRLAGAKEEVRQLEGDLSEAQIQVETALQALSSRQVARAAAEEQLEVIRQLLVGLNARQSDLGARLAERRVQLEKRGADWKAAHQAVSEGEEMVLAAEKRILASEQSWREAEDNRKKVENSLENIRQLVSELEISRQETQTAISKQQTEAARIRAQLEVVEQAEQSLTGYASGARLLLQAARQARLTGARGALSSSLDVPEKYETAIAAVLGEYLDAILLDQGTEIEQALNLLEGQPARGALLPLDSLIPGTLLSIPDGGAEVIGVATGLISVHEDLRPAIDLLLGQVLVVKDRAAARRLLGRLRIEFAAGQFGNLRVVTLKGEVFYASGQVISGQEGNPGKLSRPRQRRELGVALAEAEQNLAKIEERLKEIEVRHETLRNEGDQLGEDLQVVRRAEEKARIAHSQNSLAIEHARRQVNWQKEQVLHLEVEIKQGETEIVQIVQEANVVEEEVTQAQSRLKGISATLRDLPLEDFQVELSHWNLRTAVIELAVTEARGRQYEREQTLEKAQRDLAEINNQRMELSDTLKDLAEKKVDLRKLEYAVEEQIEALQASIGPAEKDLDITEAEQINLQSREAQSRQALNLAEHYHAQAKIALARKQEALESLRRRIEDDFGLVVFEYAEEVSGPTPLPLQGMVEELPVVKQLSPETEEALNRQRGLLRRMGPVNQEAQVEFREVKDRYEFLTDQVSDLHKAETDVRQVIAELDELMEYEFKRTFEAVAVEFHQIFARLFGGGSARLVMTDPDDLTGTGIDIEARLPGRREQGLSLLSGGERSLTAVALVFALLRVSPTPFCVLDEVDAMLDEANVGRFRELLRELSQTTQFVIITHNRNTVQVADVIYGVTMGRDSTSQTVSLKMEEVERVTKET
ncbi:MAG TPA: chromosome segregation protein SMC [Anaerolineales bacterium]|nr:chromosome segregation protein SMC [Anaerolineales bacterium]